MNPAHSVQSFPDWQPPSPRSTPQSAKFSGYQFLSPPSSEPSPGFQHGWVTPQGYVYNSAFTTPGMPVNGVLEPMSATSSLKRPRPLSYQNVQGKGPGDQYTQVPMLQTGNPAMSFPSHSFLEQFDDTHIDAPQNDAANVPTSMAAPTQVRTPPPTRKTASRRKAQPPQPPLVIPVQTPSTILSRRSSDHDAWLKRSGNSSISDMSPFNFSTLQIPPPDPMQFSSGPLTAPVYPHSQLFWDPNSAAALGHSQFPIPNENPFMGSDQSAGSALAYHTPVISPPSSAGPHGFVIPALPNHVPARPHSARPAEASQFAMLPPPRTSSHLRQASSVDPSMLISAQMAEHSALARPNSVVNSANPEERQPYQYQIEALRREKEVKFKKGIRRQTVVDSSTMGADTSDLRKNLTDQRARKAVSLPQNNQVFAAEDKDVPANLFSVPIARNSSPLKRQKSSLQQPQGVSPLKPTGRKSVVLTIDEKGRARTEVKAVDEITLRKKGSTASLIVSSSESDSDSSDLPEGPPQTRSSSALSFRRPALKSSPPSNDALDALREVVKANQQRKQVGNINLDGAVFGYGPASVSSTSMGPPALPSHYVTTPWNISPTTVADPDNQSPGDGDANFFTGTRCICNNTISDAGKYMIQCESCLKWLHIDCLGLSKHTVPNTFHCVYCTGSMPAVRNTRIRAHTTPSNMPYYPVAVQGHNYS